MNTLYEHPWLTVFFVAYVVFILWVIFRYFKPPKDPPPSGKADSSLALVKLNLTLTQGGWYGQQL